MLPKIVIVGRPNVGKSSLMNLLAKRRVSIVEPTAGVTRDRISTTIQLPMADPGQAARYAELIDTGGYGLTDHQDLTPQIERQIAQGLGEADLVLFVIDAQSGVTPLDETVAQLIRTSGAHTPILLVVNKVDSEKFEAQAYEAMRLGFGDPVMVSATTGHNKYRLYDRIHDAIDFDRFDSGEPLDTGPLLAMVGKRNVGKSTMVNALAGEQRVIVSEIEGTTRDSVDVRFEIDGKVFTAIDTAGVRKRKSLQDDIEYYSMHRSLRSVRRADVCLLLIDAAVPISQVDKKLVNEVLEHHRPTVIVVNKWDLAEKNHTQDEYVEYLDKELQGLSFAPIVFTCADRGEGMREAVAMAMNLYEQARHRVSTSELNKIVEGIMAKRQPRSKLGKQPKIYYATQLEVDPPTIALFVNIPDMFDNNYLRFFINRLREELAYSEVPIKLLIRGRQNIPASAKA